MQPMVSIRECSVVIYTSMFVRTLDDLGLKLLQTDSLDMFWTRLHHKVLMIVGSVVFEHCTVYIVVRPAMTSAVRSFDSNRKKW
jgi:hypothetical protein